MKTLKTCCHYVKSKNAVCGKRATFQHIKRELYYCLVHARQPSGGSGLGIGPVRPSMAILSGNHPTATTTSQ